MEMHQLRYVVAVARAGNFSRAAEQCHVAQPSLSQQIQKLEQELGERLFDRLGRSVKLTAVGVSFLQRATRILEEADAASREARDVQGLVNGKVALGVIPTIAPYLLPGVVAAFARKYPGLGVTVHEETTAQLLRLVNAYEIDFAIASLPIHDDRLVKETLMSEELLLAVPPRHTLAKRRGIATADLESERFILMKEGHCLGDQALQFCNRRDFQPNVSLFSSQIETIKGLVRAGLGVSLIPAMAVDGGKGPRPVYRSLGHPRPRREICVVWPRGRTPGVPSQAFLRVLRACASRYAV